MTARRRGPRRADARLYCITRHDTRTTRGWNVRVQRSDFLANKLFSDSKFGGKANALVAAVLYRNAILRALDNPREAVPGHGYTWRDVDGDRVVFRGWVRLLNRKCSRTVWYADQHGVRAAKAGADEWLARKRREIGVQIAG